MYMVLEYSFRLNFYTGSSVHHREKVLLLAESLPFLSYSHLLLTAIPVPLLPVGDGVAGPQLDKVDSLKEGLWPNGEGDPRFCL